MFRFRVNRRLEMVPSSSVSFQTVLLILILNLITQTLEADLLVWNETFEVWLSIFKIELNDSKLIQAFSFFPEIVKFI